MAAHGTEPNIKEDTHLLGGNMGNGEGRFSPTGDMLTISVVTISKGCVGWISDSGGGGDVCRIVNWQILHDFIQSRTFSSMSGHQKCILMAAKKLRLPTKFPMTLVEKISPPTDPSTCHPRMPKIILEKFMGSQLSLRSAGCIQSINWEAIQNDNKIDPYESHLCGLKEECSTILAAADKILDGRTIREVENANKKNVPTMWPQSN
uniref:Uncharacterized protein n=1 Tax=Romanomermis culicivorax TaxID=13658 RepID=A0A915L8X1_ROMCU